LSGVSAPTGDAGARARIADDHRTTLFVEAGAGTGKTTELIGRIRNLIVTGRLTDLSGLAAITFTEAAAAELRARLRDDLEAAAQVASGAEADRLGAAVDQLDDAAVTTLHGFALRLLSERPLEAGLPPVISVLGPIEAELELNERVRRLVDRLYAEHAELLERAYRLGLAPGRIVELARAFDANVDRLGPLLGSASAPLAVPDVAPLLAALDRACTHLLSCTDADDALYEYLAGDVSVLRSALVEAEGDPDRAAIALCAVTLRSANRGRQGSWGGKEQKQAVVDAVGLAVAEQERLLVAMRTEVISRLAELIAQAAVDEAAARRRTGRLEFADLLVLARDLLRDHPDVRADLGGAYPFLFVDEFQDTDPLQVEIVTHLAALDAHHDADRWEEVPVAPGRMFVVGDPKQSIYRFRRANIAVYERARAVIGEHVALSRNFRTVPSVLTWVNAVFEQLIGPGAPLVQPAYLALTAAREEQGAGPAVHQVGGPLAVERVGQAREQAAADLVRTVQGMKEAAWPVGDGEEARPIEYGDMAVLVPTRTPLSSLEAHLQAAGVPYRIESRSLVWSTDAVRDLLTVLEAIDDPDDAVAVVAALRHGALACTDADLLDWRDRGGWWNPLRRGTPEGADDHPVAHGLGRLRTLHDERMWRPVGALVAAVVEDLRLVELTTAHRRPRDHWRRLRFVVDQARAFAEAGGASLTEFLRWARLQQSEDADAVETVVPEPDDDAVRILTIHGSKGLEFPAVLLAGLDLGPQTTPPSVIWRDGGVELKVGPSEVRFATDGYDDALAVDKEHEAAERLRLLYVATTRARDHLLLFLHHKEGQDCPAATLASTSVEHPHLSVVLDPASLPDAVGTTGPAAVSVPAGWHRGADWLHAFDRRRDAASRPQAAAPSTIAKELDEAAATDEVPAEGGEVDVDGPALRLPVGRGGTSMGRAVHAVLQVVDLSAPDDLDRLAAVAASAEGIAEQAEQVAKLAASLVRSEPVQEAVRGGRYWREVFVAAPVGDRLVEGYIDLLYETDEGLVVVDHKTDRGRSQAELEASAAAYRGQGAAYAAALQQALGRPVVRAVFLFARAGEAVAVPIDDVPAAVDEVVAHLSA